MSRHREQLDLFGGQHPAELPAHTLHHEPSAPYSNDSTSKAAAESIVHEIGSLQRRVAEFVRSKGEAGATRDEIEAGLGMLGSTVRPRVAEILALGLIEETEVKRPTRTGRLALVLRAVQPSSTPTE